MNPSPSHSWQRSLALLDRGLGLFIGAGTVLVLPVSLLLFLQWPLRDLVQAYSREANDLAQWLFALYVSLALSYATRRRAHLATDALARRLPPRVHDLIARLAPLLVLVPWSLFIVIEAWASVAEAIVRLEGFPDTYNPGYFMVKASMLLLALLVLLQALLDARRPEDG